MHLGFDAKRFFHNPTGLGHYSRTLVRSLAQYFPEHDYFLFNPKPSSTFKAEGENLHEVLPHRLTDRLFRSAWRSSGVKRDLQALKIDLYHGLSHEIPLGIGKTGIPSVVTMHDLIHERYPEQYNKVDVQIYRRKFRYACTHADRVIAISRQTESDLVEFYQVPREKIRVCYQSCNPAFAQRVEAAEMERVRQLYGLPPEFFLYVGSVIERKNLLNICKAVFLLRNEDLPPLVVIGSGGKYLELVRDFVRQQGLERRILFMADNEAARREAGFRTAADFPAIYQLATAMIYPSYFEGFGIPVLEALWSRLPVITSNVSCLPEAGGAGAFYVNPASAEEIAEAMRRIYSDKELAASHAAKGWDHAQSFTPQRCAEGVMEVYQELWKNANSK